MARPGVSPDTRIAATGIHQFILAGQYQGVGAPAGGEEADRAGGAARGVERKAAPRMVIGARCRSAKRRQHLAGNGREMGQALLPSGACEWSATAPGGIAHKAGTRSPPVWIRCGPSHFSVITLGRLRALFPGVRGSALQARHDHRNLGLVAPVSLSVERDEIPLFQRDAHEDVSGGSDGKSKCPAVIDGVNQKAIRKPR